MPVIEDKAMDGIEGITLSRVDVHQCCFLERLRAASLKTGVRSLALVCLIWQSLIGVYAETDQDIVIEMQKPEVRYSYYDPEKKTPSVCGFGLAGNTSHSYNYNFSTQFRSARNGNQWRFKVTSIKVVLSLPETITLPNGASELLRANYEAYRKIYEYFYLANAQPAARLTAGLVLADPFSCTAKDQMQAEKLFNESVSKKFKEIYLTHTEDVSKCAVVGFDRLTNMGRNVPDPEEAVLYAIARCRIPMVGGD